MIRVFPSTNPSPENMLVDYIKQLQKAGVEFIHCDVMDGIFVENKCLSKALLEEVAYKTLVGLDVHLMVAEPLATLEDYLDLPATYITMHYEAFDNVQDMFTAIKKIHAKGILAGISVKPTTPLDKILNFIPMFDLVLLMSVEPGKSGQAFVSSALERISTIRNFIDDNNFNIKLQVDGGVNMDNAQKIVNAGADILVMGNAMFISRDKEKIVKEVSRMYRIKED